MRLRLALAALCVLVFPATLLADTYQYQFSSNNEYFPTQFTFDTDALITSDTTVTPTSCSFVGSDCDSIAVYPDGADFTLYTGGGYDEDVYTHFSLTELGTQTANDGSSLTITDTPSVAVTPEPSSILLLGTGILFLAGFARRRFRRAAILQSSSV